MLTSAKSTGDIRRLDLSRIAQDLQIKKVLVENVVQLLDEENTIPFIARYRKERTGGLDEEMLRLIQERLRQLRKLADRKQTILRSLQLNKLLTPELEAAILDADNPKRLEDLYLPYKKKDKATRADKARERGLAGLANAIWYADPVAGNLAELAPTMVNPEKELNSPDDVVAGVADILAERIAESADVRDGVRRVMWDTGKIDTSKNEKLADGQGLEYKGYFQFSEPLRHIPAHRVLAINRGEKENALTVKIEWDNAIGMRVALDRLPLPPAGAVPPPVEIPATVPSEAPVAGALPATAAAEEPAGLQAPPLTAEPSPPIEAAVSVPEVNPPVVEPQSSEVVAEPAANAPSVAESSPPGAMTEFRPSDEKPAADANGPRERHQRGHHGRSGAPPFPPRRRVNEHSHADFLRKITEDALSRLLIPSLEREIRRELSTRAEGHAVNVFARNLRSKLLAPPLRGKRVLAIDPAYRTGCKLAVLDETGVPLEDAVVFPNPPQNKKPEATHKLEELIRKHQVTVIAIGNGTACRETEEVVADIIGRLEARRQGGEPTKEQTAAAPEAPPTPVETSGTTAVPEPQAPDASVAMPPPMPPAAETSPAGAENTDATTPTEMPAPAPVTSAPPDATEVTAGEATPPATDTTAGPIVPAPMEKASKPKPAPLPALDHLPEASADLAYIIVNEAGASVYSASPVGREEFPNLDATLRGTISIGRRLQDPLSELVKIDPQHIGVGLYQHDVHLKQLRESLDAVVESCVNTVGVDLNTASVPLLRHVSGLNQLAARDLVEYRRQNGAFKSRDQLLQVPNIGERRYTQAAGFLKILEGADPLDCTWVHPESYPIARQLLADLGFDCEVLRQKDRLPEVQEKLRSVAPDEVARRLNTGVPTIRDILEALARPGRDPRDDLPLPVFKKGVLKIEDLQAGMELQGTVLNVVDFGAFVDVGLKESGLVHISQMANRFVKNPHEIVAVGDVVTVWVIKVDADRHHVSLAMIKPGSERRPLEKRQFPPRREGAPSGEGQAPAEGARRPPRGDRRPRGARPPRPTQPAQGSAPPAGERQPQGEQPAQGERQPQAAQPPRGERQPQAARPQQGDRPRGGRGDRPRGDRGERGPATEVGRRGLPPRGSRRQDLGARGPGRGRKPADAAETPAVQQQAQTRKAPGKPAAKPNLSQAALSGREALNTFGELAAFWEARSKQEQEQEQEQKEENSASAPASEEAPPAPE